MTIPLSIDRESRSTGESALPYWFWETSLSTGKSDHGEMNFADHFAAKWSSRATGGFFDIHWKLVSQAQPTAGLPDRAQIRSINSLRLERRVLLERRSTQVDDQFLAYADAAVHDAVSTIRRYNLSEAEIVMFSDDGILSIQWRSGVTGAALVFTGDGKIAVSVAGPGKLYSQKPWHIGVVEALPPEFIKTLKQF